jgi:hypothetical protein
MCTPATLAISMDSDMDIAMWSLPCGCCHMDIFVNMVEVKNLSNYIPFTFEKSIKKILLTWMECI